MRVVAEPSIEEKILDRNASSTDKCRDRGSTSDIDMRKTVASVFVVAVLVLTSVAVLVHFRAGAAVDARTMEDGDEGAFVTVGWTQEFRNWNPLIPQFVADWVAFHLIYSSLFHYDEDWSAVEMMLATDYYQVLLPSGGMSTFVNISKNAYFRNAAEPSDTSHPLTAFDVQYTFELIMNNPGGTLDHYVRNITDVSVTDDGEPWNYTRTDNPYQVRIDTNFPKATLIDDLVWVPILPKFWWEPVDAVGQALANKDPYDLIGSGPFYFDSMSLGQWYRFTTAPNYHCEADYGEERDIDIGGIQYQIFTDTPPLAIAMNQGLLDVIDITGAQQSTWDYVGGDTATVPIEKQAVNELGIYDIAMNGIPLEMRSSNYGDGNVILLDPVVRKAIGMTLDRQALSEYLVGDPAVADTVINPGYWHADLAAHTEVLPFSPVQARENLTAAGYADIDADGYLEVTSESDAYLLYGAAVGDELSFDLHVPDSDPAYATIGMAWVPWADEAGIKMNFAVLSEGVMISKEWYTACFDIWVWAWYWGPEPLSNLATFKTEEVTLGGYSTVGPIGDWWWVDEAEGIARSEYDVVFDEALETLDMQERKALVDEMQVMVYDEYVEFPPLYPLGLYAWTEARFIGWGDWEANPARSIISDMLWLWFDLEEAGSNLLPVFDTPLQPSYEAEIDVPVTFTVGVSDPDGDQITVNWSFGDGTPNVFITVTGDTTVEQTVQQTHTYTEAAVDLVLRVALSDDNHSYENVEVAYVDVLDPSNTPPVAAFAVDPPTGSTVTVFQFDASGSYDAETPAEDLMARWDWESDGDWDTAWTADKTETHWYVAAGDYLVTLEVMDGEGLTDQTFRTVSVSESPSGYIPHEPILIQGDDEFVFENGVVNGTGTYLDPYVIEGWSINASEADAVRIEGTTSHFIIRDIAVFDGEFLLDGDEANDGVALSDVFYGSVEDVTAWNCRYGISITNSKYIDVAGNVVYHNTVAGVNVDDGSFAVELRGNYLHNNTFNGILIRNSGNVSATTNWIEDTGWNGEAQYSIGVSNCFFCRIMGNHITNGDIGIWLGMSNECSITGNSLYGFVGQAMYLYSAEESTVTDNALIYVYSGIHAVGCRSVTIADNDVESLSGWADIECDLCLDTMVVGNSIEPATASGIEFYRCTDSYAKQNALQIAEGVFGIRFYYSTGSVAQNNSVLIEDGNGIELLFCDDSLVAGNAVVSPPEGRMGIMLHTCVGSVVSANYAISGNDAIYVTSCANTSIEDNRAHSYNETGIYVSISTGTEITGNTASTGAEKWWSGCMILARITEAMVVSNTLPGGLYGILMTDSSGVVLHHNDLINNTIHAYDDCGIENSWDNGYPDGGNYWSSYDGVDEMSGAGQDEPGPDGIGDTPFVIDLNSTDRYPLMWPANSPAPLPPVAAFIVSPELGYVGTVFTVDASSSYDREDPAESLEVRWDWENDGVWDTDWTTDKIASHQILVAGDHTIVLQVRDSDGMTDTESRVVKVFDESLELGTFPERLFMIVNSGEHTKRVDYVSIIIPQNYSAWNLELTYIDGSRVEVSVYERFITPGHLLIEAEMREVGDETGYVQLQPGTVYWIVFKYYGQDGFALLTEHVEPLSPPISNDPVLMIAATAPVRRA